MKIGSVTLIAFCVIFMNTIIRAQAPQELAAAWDRYHVSFLPPKDLKHAHLKIYLMSLKNLGVRIEEVGRSFEDREIYRIEWGTGPVKILMWSQMHGNEPTATSALLDLFTFLQKNRETEWVKNLGERLTIAAVPMLNPDGAENYRRRNAQSIDINRDALALETPEGRLLKKIRDEWQPDIGFNLHNQSPRTTVGDTKRQAAISLLVVTGNPNGLTNDGLERNKRLCAVIFETLNKFIPGHIGRYDEEFNPLAFGDLFSAGGTPVILIETGGLEQKDRIDPLFLVKMNFIAYLAALSALADGSEKKADPRVYETIPINNTGELFSIIFRNATIINPLADGEEKESGAVTVRSFTADVAVNAERRRTGEITSVVIRDIGDLSIYKGLREFDVSGFYLVAKTGRLRPGAHGELLFYDKRRQIDWSAADLTEKHKPDGIFANGRWIQRPEKIKPRQTRQ